MWGNGKLKFDLHRHFGGSISPATVYDLLQSKGHTAHLVHDRGQVADAMVCTRPATNFLEFLSKFELLNHVVWDEEAIATSVRQVVKDQADDAIDYSEITLSIEKYVNTWMPWTRAEVIKFIRAMFNEYCTTYGTSVSLTLSLKMEGDRRAQRELSKLLDRSDVADCLGGIDIVGDERFFSTDFYAPLFRDWRRAGKVTLAHVGEAVDPETGRRNVRDAIAVLGVNRTRHAIAAAEDPDILQLANDNGVYFDVSLHSNWLAGTTPDMKKHHLPALIKAKCRASLGTDDPITFCCDLQDEYDLAEGCGLLGGTDEEVATNTANLQDNAIAGAGRDAESVKQKIYCS